MTLIAVLPDGQAVTRTTARQYTHIVAVLPSAEYLRESDLRNYRDLLETADYYSKSHTYSTTTYEADPAKVEEILAEADELMKKIYRNEYTDGDWEVSGWCGRPDLAEKLASSQSQRRVPKHMNEVLYYSDVCIIEVTAS
jgi:hypothetical protein